MIEPFDFFDPPKARKPRKPKDFKSMASIYHVKGSNIECVTKWVLGESFTPKEARKLAAWLLKAADYLENVEHE